MSASLCLVTCYESRKVLIVIAPLLLLGFCVTSSLAQDAKVKATPNTTAKDFSCDANEYCFIVVFIIYSFYFVLLVNNSLLVFP